MPSLYCAGIVRRRQSQHQPIFLAEMVWGRPINSQYMPPPRRRSAWCSTTVSGAIFEFEKKHDARFLSAAAVHPRTASKGVSLFSFSDHGKTIGRLVRAGSVWWRDAADTSIIYRKSRWWKSRKDYGEKTPGASLPD